MCKNGHNFNVDLQWYESHWNKDVIHSQVEFILATLNSSEQRAQLSLTGPDILPTLVQAEKDDPQWECVDERLRTRLGWPTKPCFIGPPSEKKTFHKYIISDLATEKSDLVSFPGPECAFRVGEQNYVQPDL